MKLQNLALATMTGPAVRSQPKNVTAYVRYAINKCESLGSRKQLVFHGNPSAIRKDFLQSFDVFFYRICNLSAVCCFKAPLEAILTSLRPAVNPLLGCFLVAESSSEPWSLLNSRRRYNRLRVLACEDECGGTRSRDLDLSSFLERPLCSADNGGPADGDEGFTAVKFSSDTSSGSGVTIGRISVTYGICA